MILNLKVKPVPGKNECFDVLSRVWLWFTTSVVSILRGVHAWEALACGKVGLPSLRIAKFSLYSMVRELFPFGREHLRAQWKIRAASIESQLHLRELRYSVRELQQKIP